MKIDTEQVWEISIDFLCGKKLALEWNAQVWMCTAGCKQQGCINSVHPKLDPAFLNPIEEVQLHPEANEKHLGRRREI